MRTKIIEQQKFSLTLFIVALSLTITGPLQAQLVPTQMQVADWQGVFQFGALRVIPVDSQYMSVDIWNLLDSCSADSVTKVFPNASPSDTTLVRPDGKIRRLFDLTIYYNIYFSDSVDWLVFTTEYELLNPVSVVSPVHMGQSDFIPLDLDTSKQGYMLSPAIKPNGIDAVGAWDVTAGNASELLCIIDQGFDSGHFELQGRITGDASVDGTSPYDGIPSKRWHGAAVASVMMANQNDSGMVGVNWNTPLYVVRESGLSSSWGAALDLADVAGARYSIMALGYYPTVNPCTHVEGALAAKSYNAWVAGRMNVASKGNLNIDEFHLPSDILTLAGVGSVNTFGLKHTHSYSQGKKLAHPANSCMSPTLWVDSA